MKKYLLFTLVLVQVLFSCQSFALTRKALIQGNQVFCSGDSAYLFVTGGCYTNCNLTGVQWYFNGSPINGATTLGYVTTAPGLYSCNVTMPTCYAYGTDTIIGGMTDTFRVIGHLSGTFTLLSDTNVCDGDTITIRALKTGPAANYPQAESNLAGLCSVWRQGSNGVDTIFATTLPYPPYCTLNNSKVPVTVSISYSAGYCSVGSTVTCVSKTYIVNRLNVLQRPLTTTGSNPFCSGDSLSLEIDPLFSIPGQTYVWKRNNSPINGATASSYTAKLNGSYFAVVNYQQGCSANTDTVTAVVYPSPQPSVTLVSGNLWQVSQSYISYQWYRNDTLIPGATQSSFTIGSANVTDYWYLIVTDANGCTGKSNLIGITGIANVNATSFSIYPNPVTDQLAITGIAPNTQLTITDLIGETLFKSVAQGTIETIDVSKLPRGVYFLNHQKFIKQ